MTPGRWSSFINQRKRPYILGSQVLHSEAVPLTPTSRSSEEHRAGGTRLHVGCIELGSFLGLLSAYSTSQHILWWEAESLCSLLSITCRLSVTNTQPAHPQQQASFCLNPLQGSHTLLRP